MSGDARSRHCSECKTQVFNLSEMSREQGERLVIERNGDLCARYYQRADGTILTADCAVGAHERHRKRVAAYVGIAVAMIGGGVGAAHKLATNGTTADAPPEIRFDNTDSTSIEIPEAEAQPEPEAIVEGVRSIKEILDREHIQVVMGKISVVDHEQTLQKLELDRVQLEKLKLEVTK